MADGKKILPWVAGAVALAALLGGGGKGLLGGLLGGGKGGCSDGSCGTGTQGTPQAPNNGSALDNMLEASKPAEFQNWSPAQEAIDYMSQPMPQRPPHEPSEPFTMELDEHLKRKRR